MNEFYNNEENTNYSHVVEDSQVYPDWNYLINTMKHLKSGALKTVNNTANLCTEDGIFVVEINEPLLSQIDYIIKGLENSAEKYNIIPIIPEP